MNNQECFVLVVLARIENQVEIQVNQVMVFGFILDSHQDQVKAINKHVLLTNAVRLPV